MEAVERKDRPRLEQLLAPDFELRSIASAWPPVRRAEWLENAVTMDWQHRGYRDLHVDLHGDVAVVSSTLTVTVDAGKWRPPITATATLVDIWESRGGQWQVRRRLTGGDTITRWRERIGGFLSDLALAALFVLARSFSRRASRRSQPKRPQH